MRVKKPGKIRDNLWFFGWEESCVYLLEGRDESILINGGLSCLVPDLLRQFKEFDVDESRITKILLLHSHFDHVGIAPFLKRRHPGLVLYASARAVEVLKKPKVIRAINDANQYVIESRGLGSLCTHLDLAWRTGIECVPVREGDQIDLGDQKLKVYATPGHSPCSISAYVPGMKVLFPSESAGIPFRDKISTYGISDLSAFEQSLQKLKNLQVSCLCSDHYGYVFGDEADGFIAASIKVAKSRRKLMESALRLSGGVDEAARQIAKLFQDEGEFNLVPEDVFFESHRQMIMHIAGHLR